MRDRHGSSDKGWGEPWQKTREKVGFVGQKLLRNPLGLFNATSAKGGDPFHTTPLRSYSISKRAFQQCNDTAKRVSEQRYRWRLFWTTPQWHPPPGVFFSSRLCARRNSCHWRWCPRAAFSETILFEDAAALGHLVSERMRVWKKKHLQGEERFFSSQRWQANTTEAKITSAIAAVCVGKTSYKLWIIPRTSHWNHELGDRAMGESRCTCNLCSLSLSPCACV